MLYTQYSAMHTDLSLSHLDRNCNVLVRYRVVLLNDLFVHTASIGFYEKL